MCFWFNINQKYPKGKERGFEYQVGVYYKGMAQFPLMAAVSITQAENISVHAELFPCFILHNVFEKAELLNAHIFPGVLESQHWIQI